MPWLLFSAAVVAALALRLPQLEQRAMHTDEAVHAIKFGALLEHNAYRYDPFEYHGPTLNYFTLVPAWLRGQTSLTEVDEITLRLVPAAFGVLLILLLLLLRDGLGPGATASAATLVALSPAMAYYSRYYIQEMLLVGFTFAFIAAGYRYWRRPGIGWALFAGVALGLMHATKETFVLPLAAAAVALFLLRLFPASQVSNRRRPPWRHLLAGTGAALLVSMLLFSSFFDHPRGVLDSFLTYGTYLSRAGEDGLHRYPWYYYFSLLLFFRLGDGPWWSEGFVLLLALIGGIAAFLPRQLPGDRRLLRFLALYTLMLTVVFCLIPYKTPWNALLFWHGLLLLAGAGAIALWHWPSRPGYRALLAAMLTAGALHLGWQSYRANFLLPNAPENPYVYAHPTAAVFDAVAAIRELASAHPDSTAMYIQFACSGDDYWPFPWYLRDFTRIGWWETLPAEVPVAPLIVISPDQEASLVQRLYEEPPPGQRELYVPIFPEPLFLRPGVEIRGFAAKSLWDRLAQQQSPPPDLEQQP